MTLPKRNRLITQYGATTPTFIAKWVYRFEPAPTGPDEWITRLDELGSDGWELVETVASLEGDNLVQQWLLKKPDVSDLEHLFRYAGDDEEEVAG